MNVTLEPKTTLGFPTQFTTRSEVKFSPGLSFTDHQTETKRTECHEVLKDMLQQITGLPVAGRLTFTVTKKHIQSSGRLSVYFGQQQRCSDRIRQMMQALDDYRRRFPDRVTSTVFEVQVRIEFA